MKNLMILLTMIFAATSDPMDENFPFVWPMIFLTPSEGPIILIYEQMNSSDTIYNTYVDNNPAATDAKPISIVGIGNGEKVQLSMMRFMENKIQGRHVKFMLKNIHYNLQIPRRINLIGDLFLGRPSFLGHCPSSHGFTKVKVPCILEEELSPICSHALICQRKLMLERPDALTTLKNKTVYMDKHKTCIEIPTVDRIVQCKEKMALEKISETIDKSRWCSISKAAIKDSDTLRVYIPYRIGGNVCLKYVVKGKETQECKTNQADEVSMDLPKAVKGISIMCDGNIGNVFYQSSVDLPCPFINMSPWIAKRICQTAWRPAFFWISMSWLITGMPFIYICMCICYKLKCWYHIRKLMNFNKKIKCPNCRCLIGSLIEASDHEQCDQFVCPFCKTSRMTQNDFCSHVMKCDRQAEFRDKMNEILRWEKETYRERYSTQRMYRKSWVKLSWIILFAIIFCAMFVPAVSSRHSSHQLCTTIGKIDRFGYLMDKELNSARQVCSNERLLTSNEHVPQKTHTESRETEEEFDSEPANNGALIEMTKSIIETIEESKMDIQKNLENSKHIMEAELDNIKNKIEQVISEQQTTHDLNLKCQGLFQVMYINQLFPNKTVSGNPIIRIHEDDVYTLLNAADNLKTHVHMEQDPNSRIEISSGPDAAIQVGRDNQHMQGGSGGNNKFGIGSSSNTDIKTDDRKERMTFRERLEKSRIDTRRHKRSLSADEGIINNEISIIETEGRKKIEDEVLRAKERMRLPSLDFLDFEDQESFIQGQLQKVTSHTIHDKLTVFGKNDNQPLKETHESWYDFVGMHHSLCKKNCLHEPSTCECIGEKMPENGKYELPWTTLSSSDIHLRINPSKFSSHSIDSSFKTDKTVTLKTKIETKLDLFEGSFVTFKLENEDIDVKPVISVVIPRITQIYATSLMYYTCERRFDTEVKSLCTGGCEDYCGGKVCLGTRIWKWQNCRKVWCNPSWCWATNDGCCCCGANVYCDSNAKVGALWKTDYRRTEAIVCVLYNDRLQNCRLASGTDSFNFGNIEVDVTKILEPSLKLPKFIFSVHEPININSHQNLIHAYEDASNIYLDPDVCKSEASCNHGFIGDVQVMNVSCLSQLGQFCKTNKEDLKASDCSDKVFVSHANTKMGMTCHSFHYHSCEHQNSVEEIKFEDHLKNSAKLTDKFSIKKQKINLNEGSLLIYATPLDEAGFMEVDIKVDGITYPIKDHKIDIKDFKLDNCAGCYSCKKGFYCDVFIESESPDEVLVLIHSTVEEVDFGKSPVSVHQGLNKFKIWGVAYADIKLVKACIFMNGKCGLQTKSTAKFELPTGQFVPQFKDIIGNAGEDNSNECSGFSWFSCAFGSIKNFFGMIWDNLGTIAFWIIIIVIIVLICMFLPHILILMSYVKDLICTRKKSRLVYKGKKVNDVYSDLSYKMRKRESMRKKNDSPISEEVSLLINDGNDEGNYYEV